jgi:hypothetical protein
MEEEVMATTPDINVKINVDASQLWASLWRVEQRMLLHQINRAMMIAVANGCTLVRIVIGYRMAKRLVDENAEERSSFGPIKAIYGVPVAVDSEVPDGFGLVTRPPAT